VKGKELGSQGEQNKHSLQLLQASTISDGMALAGGACCVRPSAAHFQCDAFCSSRDTGLQQLTTGTHWQPTSVRAFTACSACVFQSGRM